MITKRVPLAIYAASGSYPFIDFTRNGSSLSLTGLAFQAKVINPTTGAIYARFTPEIDANVTGRLWLTMAPSEAAKIPSGRNSMWFLLHRNASGKVLVLMLGPVACFTAGASWE